MAQQLPSIPNYTHSTNFNTRVPGVTPVPKVHPTNIWTPLDSYLIRNPITISNNYYSRITPTGGIAFYDEDDYISTDSEFSDEEFSDEDEDDYVERSNGVARLDESIRTILGLSDVGIHTEEDYTEEIGNAIDILCDRILSHILRSDFGITIELDVELRNEIANALLELNRIRRIRIRFQDVETCLELEF